MLLDDYKLDGKTAIVTGAGKGIGKSVAEGLAQVGANVVCAARTQDDVDAASELVASYGVKSLAISCDITKEEDLRNLVEKTVEAFGGIDILVNNAGAPGPGYGPIDTVGKDKFEQTVAINLTSTYTLTHLCLPFLRKASSPTVVNVSSALSWMVQENVSAYAAAKAGVEQMTRVMGYELAPDIRVNAIAPGAIDTPSAAFIKSRPALLEATERFIPLQRLGRPEEIAQAVLFLASKASSFISGKVIEVDGGMQALPGTAIQNVIYSAQSK